MAGTSSREIKAERLEVRLTPAAKALLGHAARLKHTTLSEFLVSSAVRAAEGVLVSPRVFEVGTDDDWRALLAVLDESPSAAPDPVLTDLLSAQPLRR